MEIQPESPEPESICYEIGWDSTSELHVCTFLGAIHGLQYYET